MSRFTPAIVMGAVALGLCGIGIALVLTGHVERLQDVLYAVLAVTGYAAGRMQSTSTRSTAGSLGGGAAMLALGASAGELLHLLGG